MARRAERICAQALGSERRFAGRLDLGRHLPRGRRPPAARVRGRDRPRSRPSPSSTASDAGRPDRPGARRARPGARPSGASRRRAPASRSTPTRSTPQAPLDDVLRAAFPGAPNGQAELKRLFAAYVEAKQRRRVLDYDDLLLWWARMLEEPALAARDGRPLRPRPGRRVPGHQRACRRRSCWR